VGVTRHDAAAATWFIVPLAVPVSGARHLLLVFECLERKQPMPVILKTSYKRVAQSLLVKSNPDTQLFVRCLKHVMVWWSLIIHFGIGFWGRLYPIARHIDKLRLWYGER
jgi:hypothetical protein